MTLTIANVAFEHVEYDARRDVLYLSVGSPRPAALVRETPSGHVVRYDENDALIGLTIINAGWLEA